MGITEKIDLLTPREVAERVGVSLITLRNWRYERKNLRYIRAGNRVYYKPSDVDSFVEVYHRIVEVADGQPRI